MNELGHESSKCICGKMNICNTFLNELCNEMEMLKHNEHIDITEHDRNNIEFSCRKLNEARECIQLAYLNMKSFI